MVAPLELVDINLDEQNMEKEWMETENWIHFYFNDKLRQFNLREGLRK